MGKSAPAPPPPPDYRAAAQEQGTANVEAARIQAQLNNPDYYTPYGSQVSTPIYGPDGKIQRFSVRQTLSPDQQRLLNISNRTSEALARTGEQQLGRVNRSFNTPFDWSSLPEAPGADAAARQQVIDALYEEQSSKLDPQFSQRDEQMRVRLANQGIAAGSEAFGRETGEFGRERQSAYEQARRSAIIGGGQEQSRLFDIGQSARQNAIQEREFERNRALNELNALRSGTQVTMPQFQQFSGGGQIQAPNLFGAAQAQGQDAASIWNQQAASQAGQTAGLYGLGGVLGSAGIYAVM